MEKTRIDKWLWAARFYKTRSLAAQEISAGRVQINGKDVKPARDVAINDLVTVRKPGATSVDVHVVAISNVRGPAPVARQLYSETEASVAAREKAIEMRRLAPEPAHSLTAGRPTKRDRRKIDQARYKFLEH